MLHIKLPTALAVLLLLVAGASAQSVDARSITITGVKPAQHTGAHPEAAPPDCIVVRTAADLNAIRNNLSGIFCLGNDIDLGGIDSFLPIGAAANPFVGALYGRGHVIENLKITRPRAAVGLFGRLGAGGLLANVRLVNADVRRSGPPCEVPEARKSVGGRATFKNRPAAGGLPAVGALAGNVMPGARIIGSRASGTVVSELPFAAVGGLVGHNLGEIIGSEADVAASGVCDSVIGGLAGVSDFGALIDSSSARGPVTDRTGSLVAGLAGANAGAIRKSFATGAVRVGAFGGAGGLVADNLGSIHSSAATGPVSGRAAIILGGLVGWNESGGGSIRLSHATGSVKGRVLFAIGGLVAVNDAPIRQSFAAGLVEGSGPGQAGGLVGGSNCGCSPEAAGVTAGYWDTETSRLDVSDGGIGRTTAQLQAELPVGFAPQSWSITPNVSYPYLDYADAIFVPPLAITLLDGRLYTFLPIGQLDPSQYSTPVLHAGQASLATAYTMLSRAIGTTGDIGVLEHAPINKYWDDATRTAKWRGAITQQATLGEVMPIPAAIPINESNVIGPLRSRQIVILRGQFDRGGGATRTHWMLATSFTVDDEGAVTRVIANDPRTGQQVRINPVTKRVASPADFPLANFRVDGFQVVTLEGSVTASR